MRSDVDLVADRFLLRAGGPRALDLANGEHVWLVAAPAGPSSEERQWSARCDFFCRLHHRVFARLIDYGLCGRAQRFEAWQSGSPWRGAPVAGTRAVEIARKFLHANGLASDGLALDSVHDCQGRPVVVPAYPAGCAGRSVPDPNRSAAAGITLDICGMTLIHRPAVAAVAELLAQSGPAGPRAAALWIRPSCGADVAVAELARMARQHGLVPVAVDRIGSNLHQVLAGRTLCLIDRYGGRSTWDRLLAWSACSPRSHVLIHIGTDETLRMPGVVMDQVDASQLVASVRPLALPDTVRRRIEATARRSGGSPARFAQLLWGSGAAGRVPSTGSLAAERPALAYGEAQPPTSVAVDPAEHTWVTRGELSALQSRLETALGQLARGRHAPGDRAARAAVGSLARRHDWRSACRGTLAVASSLLKRGRPRDALAAVAEAQKYAQRITADPPHLDVTIVSGAAHLDLGRIDDADRMLSAAVLAARASDAPARLVDAATGLARTYFWRGRYSEGEDMLATIEPPAASPTLALRLAVARSRLAVGRQDLAAALSHAAIARQAAERAGDPALVADAACAGAFAHLNVADHGAVERDATLCLRAARLARDPLRAVKARLIAAESARRMNRTGPGSALVSRLKKAPLPATVRARALLLADLLSGPPPTPSAVVNRHVDASGLAALALFAPADGGRDPALATAFETAIEILQACQSADEEARILAGVCARIRSRVRAAGVGMFVQDGSAIVPLAEDGARPDSPMAERVVAARQAIAPYLQHDRIEGGAPIRYGGETLGALVARWTLGSSPDPARAQMLLTMSATAAAPAVAAALSGRRQPPRGTVGELLGASSAMGDVRKAIERAASAPFAVLVEGESGCGKELVARALHRRSARRDRPFCTLNCAALPDDLVEAELFGHARGAFTGAVAERPGVFEEAHTGTLFLDEIGELSPRAQAKVLRTIQEGELRRVGENASRRIDVRIVSATNRDLRSDAAAGRFRLDLLYRLDVIRITLPPLRERREDVVILAEHFWREAAARVGCRTVLGADTLAALARYDWPGNVRELQNVLAALAVRSPRRGVIAASALPPPFGAGRTPPASRLDEARRTFEANFVRAALVRTGGHRSRAAQELGLTRQGLTKLMSRLHIQREG
jgi:DNA-binding NtrC family response regulator